METKDPIVSSPMVCSQGQVVPFTVLVGQENGRDKFNSREKAVL